MADVRVCALAELPPGAVKVFDATPDLPVGVTLDMHANVYDVIFRFFEVYADADCGAPGTFVHLVEAFYPNYVDSLLASVDRKTSYNGVLMINRILNSKVNDDLRNQLMTRIVRASRDETAATHVREMAARFVQRHS